MERGRAATVDVPEIFSQFNPIFPCCTAESSALSSIEIAPIDNLLLKLSFTEKLARLLGRLVKLPDAIDTNCKCYGKDRTMLIQNC